MKYVPDPEELAVADILDRAADLLETKGWIQRARARDVYGYIVDACSPTAARFCVIGAITRSSQGEATPRLDAALREFAYRKSATLPVWNDRRTQERIRVIRALRSAASRIRTKGFVVAHEA